MTQCGNPMLAGQLLIAEPISSEISKVEPYGPDSTSSAAVFCLLLVAILVGVVAISVSLNACEREGV